MVTGTYPIFQTIFNRLLIHPPILVELLEMFGSNIKLRPYRDHHTGMHSMDGINHCFRVRKTSFIKLMTSPGILRPMIPIQYDIIQWNFTITETFQCSQHFLLCIILLTTLPETHCPFRHNGRLSGQRTITANHVVHIPTSHKIIIELLGHFTPPRLLPLFFRINRCQCTQSAIRLSAIRLPLDFQRHTLSCFQMSSKLITIRIPCSPPTFRHYRLIVQIDLNISRIIKNKLKLSRLSRFYLSFISDFSPH